MQATCAQCGQRILIDDARVPDRPFSIKCPKCQNVLKLAGKTPASQTAAEPPPAVVDMASNEEARAPIVAPFRREAGPSEGLPPGSRALVALQDRAQTGAVMLLLSRHGFGVENCEDADDGARLLEQGVYAAVVTARTAAAQGKAETLYQRLQRLNPDARRHLFLVLIGEEFKTGDGMQAFSVLADLVIHPRDLAAADAVLRNAFTERQRMYHAFLDARRRAEASTA